MSLKQIAISRFANLICGVKLLDNVESAREIAKYVHQLPVHLIDDIFSHLVNTNDEYLSSSEIAILLHSQKKKLIIDDLVNANGSCFDIQLMVDISGCNMMNLTELQLPVACSLPSTICQQLCQQTPNLQTLNLYCVQIHDDSMTAINQLNLRELNLNYTNISDTGAAQLCATNSKIKTTLRILRTYGTRMSTRGHLPIFDSMPNLEDIDSNYSTLTLLNLLKSSHGQQREQGPILSLRRLRTTPIRPNVVKAQHVKMALKICPKIEEIQFERFDEPERVLDLISGFKNLSRLELRHNNDTDYSLEEVVCVLARFCASLTDLKISNFASKSEFFRGKKIYLDFVNLEKLTLTDNKSFPVSRDLIVCFLERCFHLNYLRLCCGALTDDVIFDVLSRNSMNRLKCLSLSNCPELSVFGAVEILKIPSLTMVTLMDSFSREQQEELSAQVDVEKLNLFCADSNLYF
uniref:F-box domain-containing protein n=1 Tax=Strigamia maritima TaxID=126957 RepID=T1INE7_STRMM